MGRTVMDVAAVAAVIAERPLGFGKHGSDIEGFRLRGVRIGALPVAKAFAPGCAEALCRCARGARAGRRDPRRPEAAGGLRRDGRARARGALYEFKASINEYSPRSTRRSCPRARSRT